MKVEATWKNVVSKLEAAKVYTLHLGSMHEKRLVASNA
jgi:hypothetical protein